MAMAPTNMDYIINSLGLLQTPLLSYQASILGSLLRRVRLQNRYTGLYDEKGVMPQSVMSGPAMGIEYSRYHVET